MKKMYYIAAFVAGAAAGSAVTWCLLKKKYERIAQEEIDSVKETFAKRKQAAEAGDSEQSEKQAAGAAKQAKEKPDIKAYTEFIRNIGYASVNADYILEINIPYVISPEEFGERDDYETISLTWYADGVLADENDDILEDAERMIGDALEHFGEYEDDSVFVRCDERKCDYEILLDQRKYSDFISRKPRQVEVR